MVQADAAACALREATWASSSAMRWRAAASWAVIEAEVRRERFETLPRRDWELFLTMIGDSGWKNGR